MSEVRVCPECDSAPIEHHVSGASEPNRLAEPESDYRCESCGATFNEPATRESRGTGHTGAAVLKRAGYAHLLDDHGGAADADSVGPLSALERDHLLVVASLTAAPEAVATISEVWEQLGQLRDADAHPDDQPIRETARRNLNRLAEYGFLRTAPRRGENTYRVTDAGRQRLRERERQLAATLQALDMPDGGVADE